MLPDIKPEIKISGSKHLFDPDITGAHEYAPGVSTFNACRVFLKDFESARLGSNIR